MPRKNVTVIAATLALSLPGASCGSRTTPEAVILQARPDDSDAVKYAKSKWQMLCATCHGPSGKGDGPAGGALNPKPRSFHDASWQASVDDAHIRQIILQGGAAVGKSALMPANPDLQDKPEAVRFLVDVVRSFGE